MSRLHGKKGLVCLGLTPGAPATPVAFLSDWTISVAVTYADVTKIGDAQRSSIATIEDTGGDFAGFYDDATAQSYKAAVDGVPRDFLLYPTTDNAGQYFTGSVIITEFDVTAGVAAASAIKSVWAASGPITLVSQPSKNAPAGVAAVSAAATAATAVTAGGAKNAPAGFAQVSAAAGASITGDAVGANARPAQVSVTAVQPTVTTGGASTSAPAGFAAVSVVAPTQKAADGANAGAAAVSVTATPAVVTPPPSVRGRKAGDSGSSTTTTFTPSLSTGWTGAAPQNGDWLFLVGFWRISSGATTTQTAGTGTWTIDRGGDQNTGGGNSFIAHRVFQTGDTDPTFTFGGSAATNAWAMIALKPGGTMSIDTIPAPTITTTAANSFSVPSATASGTDDVSLLLGGAGCPNVGANQITPSPPSGWTGTTDGADFAGWDGGAATRANCAFTHSQIGTFTGTVSPANETLTCAQTVVANIYQILVADS